MNDICLKIFKNSYPAFYNDNKSENYNMLILTFPACFLICMGKKHYYQYKA